MGPKEVLALAYRKGLRSIDYDDLAGKSLKTLLPGEESGLLILFTDHSHPDSKVGHFCLLFKTKRTGIHHNQQRALETTAGRETERKRERDGVTP